jgi:uncharacterized protein
LQRFELRLDGHLCVCEYRRQGDVVAFTHTEVPPELGGRGLAGILVNAALQWVRDEGLRMRPLCSYVARHVQRHTQWADLLADSSH